MNRNYLFVRNVVCSLFALGIIASGRVRRAKQFALNGEVVTAIYFHKPAKKLFAQCIQWLINNGYTFISGADLAEILYYGKTPPRGAVWLSLDDACRELLENVLPLIRTKKIPVTLFIPAGIVGGDGILPWLHKGQPEKLNGKGAQNPTRDTLTVAEVKLVSSYRGTTIGSHTVSHAVTSSLTEEQVCHELHQSKQTLELWIGSDVPFFAYPEGRFDGRERCFLEKFGYSIAATTENAFIGRRTDPYLVPRFSVADDIYFPEAVCNMVGVWRPAIDPVIKFVSRCRTACTEFQWRTLFGRASFLSVLDAKASSMSNTGTQKQTVAAGGVAVSAPAADTLKQ